MASSESRCLIQCRSCSHVITKSDSCEMLSATVCSNCGTLQGKEEIVFETPSPMSFPSRNCVLPESSTFRRFVAKASSVTNTLHMPSHLTQKVIDLAEKIYNDSVLKQQKSGPKMAACIHYVTRSNGYIIPIQKLSSATETRIACVHKCLKLCIKRLQLKPLSHLGCASFLEEYSAYFNADSPHVVIEWSKGIEYIAKKTVNSISPSIAAASLIKIVLEGRNISHDFQSFCKKFSINFQHAKNVTSLIRRSLLSFAQRIPWKPSTLNQKNIASFLPEIMSYHKEFMQDSNSPTLSSNVSCLPDKLQLVLEARNINKNSSVIRQNDHHCDVIWQLLDKGCPKEEILAENLSTLSKRYLDFTNDMELDDTDIPDEEIEELLK